MNPIAKLFGLEADAEPTPDELNDVETLDLSDYDGEPMPEPEETYPELVPVRVQIDPSDGYAVIGHNRWYGIAQANGSGVATLNLPSPAPGFAWLIDRIGVSVSSGTYTTMVTYEGSPSSGIVLDVSRQVPDIADECHSIWFGEIDINFQAVGMTPGASLKVNVQYQLARRLNESVGY